MSEQIQFDDRMSDSDALMWKIERDPRQRSTIVSVLVLDGEPDPQRFETSLENMVRGIPRLQQRVVEDMFGLAPPRWAPDQDFDMGYHVRHIKAPGDGSPQELLNIAATVGAQSFDRDRPLWEYHVVHDLADGQTGLILKLNHAISDGVGLVRMSSYFLEIAPDESGSVAPTEIPDPGRPIASTIGHTLDAWQYRVSKNVNNIVRTNLAIADNTMKLMRNPLETLTEFTDTLGSVRRLLQSDGEPLSPLMRGRSLTSNYCAFHIELDALKKAAKAAGGTLNDAFVAGVAGGLALYHAKNESRADEMRMQMPINIRNENNENTAGNQFVPGRLLVPLNIEDPVERMREIGKRVNATRSEPALPMIQEIAGVLNQLPERAATSIFGSLLDSVDFTTSNVPGIPMPLYVSGAKVLHQFGFGPLAGVAVNITVLSYNGQFGYGLNMDRMAVRDPDAFVQCIQQGTDEILALAN